MESHRSNDLPRRAVSCQVLLCALYVNLVCLVVIVLLLFFLGGHGQSWTPQLAVEKLANGMTVSQAEYALGLAPGRLRSRVEYKTDGTQTTAVAEPGLGALFVPQYRILLVFGKDQRLKECLAKVVWGVEEQRIECPLKQEGTRPLPGNHGNNGDAPRSMRRR